VLLCPLFVYRASDNPLLKGERYPYIYPFLYPQSEEGHVTPIHIWRYSIKAMTTKRTGARVDSITKRNVFPRGAFKYVSGTRGLMGARVDLGLYRRFKTVAKAVNGSVCSALEIYMATLISAAENDVTFCYTGKPLNIEKIVIERNLRPRRRLEFRGDCELARCYVEGCGCVVAGSATYLPTGVLYHCCKSHLDRYAKDPRWRVKRRDTK